MNRQTLTLQIAEIHTFESLAELPSHASNANSNTTQSYLRVMYVTEINTIKAAFYYYEISITNVASVLLIS